MTDRRASTALTHLRLDDPLPPRLMWAILSPDPSGRVQLSAAVARALGSNVVRARAVDGVLVLGRAAGEGGRHLGIDRRGRLYVPAWLRRPALVAVADPADGVVVVADVAVLDAVGDRLLQAGRG